MSDTDCLIRHKDVVELLKDGLSMNKTSKYTGKAFVTLKAFKMRMEQVA